MGRRREALCFIGSWYVFKEVVGYWVDVIIGFLSRVYDFGVFRLGYRGGWVIWVWS